GETVTCAGEYYDYREAVIAPLPVQQPLPLWIGGDSKAAIRRTATIGSGWLGGLHSPVQVARVVAAIKAAAAEAGRAIDDDHYGAAFAYRFGSPDDAAVQRLAAGFRRRLPDVDPDGYFVVGDAGGIRERIAEYVAAGASKFVLRPIADGDAEMRAQTQRLIEDVLPAVHERAATPA
ncbi:MAG: LLM class flavin-dependent oxidoreductase, partial [Chloroflexi bacterium]|nr:LLM class flavin-dependent oxidoreductase [Chloroflexota bacterium]